MILIISNDAEYYSYVISYAILRSRYSTKMKNLVKQLNQVTDLKEGLISKHYSVLGKEKRNFFSRKCKESRYDSLKNR